MEDLLGCQLLGILFGFLLYEINEFALQSGPDWLAGWLKKTKRFSAVGPAPCSALSITFRQAHTAGSRPVPDEMSFCAASWWISCFGLGQVIF